MYLNLRANFSVNNVFAKAGANSLELGNPITKFLNGFNLFRQEMCLQKIAKLWITSG